MKVKDLITELQKLDPEMLVLVQGYEGGFDEIKIKQKTVALTDDIQWYYGVYEESNRKNFSGNINATILAREKNDEEEE